MDELQQVIRNLPDGKAAGLFGISNKLWKHSDSLVLNSLLGIFNGCLKSGRILSKIFSDRIFLAYNRFDILHGDNFLVLKGTSTQFSIFVVGSIVKDALEKNRKLIKMYFYFISFFGSIHNGRFNQVMIEFGLSDGYVVHDSNNRILFFVMNTFVDDTIWVGNYLVVTQNILNIASKFFSVNDILINTEKTVTIPINQDARKTKLFISGSRISMAKKGESHHYLGIFLSTKSLSKPSLAKAHIDVKFFLNVVLKKAITKKQFLYLVFAVLQPIICYRLQFSFASKSVCEKWNKSLRKELKFKANLPKNFSSVALHYPELYGLKLFEQVLFKNLLANLINFNNIDKTLSRFFKHRAIDLQAAS
ncbi:hypothetical protein G9A89_022114 [Geosiphon pyriformis]|nr:hypothetical protein G9A89_022114 [Geosiphon pyriformis]